ncbi:hypothetical protein KTC97_15325 [Clostridium estertheticum]|uniref:Uncharacterized protein n=1 Tax=Clostridium estertheticum subsp. estertheticum TaxID=1552 RepID=A0A1J0GD21_9CLOT|nr:hypothetical protein A7L45_03850 [Clostridium estertheticum subsp. estertheticum]MBW9154772.1 hypothetical protein [Clostridium estertheticum]WLC83445.1 hypothetical protein KTC97_15325 [Clostridium estertheticum]
MNSIVEGELKLDNNKVIRTLTIYGNSLKKLYKFVPENCIKATPYTISDVLKYDLEVNINGVIFTGKDDSSYIVINSSNRYYTKEELIAFQKIAVKCYTYPFGGLEISFGLNIFTNDKTEKTITALLNKYKIEPLLDSLDSEGRIELRISNVKYFATQSFINFILELQTLTHLLAT